MHNPNLTITYPVEGELQSRPTKADGHVGRYQTVVLDTETGELGIHEADWRNRGARDERFADEGPARCFSMSAPYYQDRFTGLVVPREIVWHIDPGSDTGTYLDHGQLCTLLDDLAPRAKFLLSVLRRVEGMPGADWSAQSIREGFAIAGLVDRQRTADRWAPPRLVDMSVAVQSMPEMIEAGWSAASDADLDDAAETLARFAGHNKAWFPELPNRLGYDLRRGEPLYVVGTRAFLYDYRRRSCEMPVVDAASWINQDGGPVVTVSAHDSNDTLAEMQKNVEAEAQRAGLRLVGADAELRRIRLSLREEEMGRLRRIGERLRRAETERDALLAGVFADDDNTEYGSTRLLAELSGLSKSTIDNRRREVETADAVDTLDG